MADITKYAPINGGTLLSDFKSHFSLFKTRRTVTLAYAFIFIFIAFTIFLAFSPSSNSASPWFSNIFTTSSPSSSSSSSSSVFSDQSYRSHFSSVYYYFFPNSSSQSHHSSLTTNAGSATTKDPPVKPDNSTNLPPKPSVNQTVNSKSEELKQNQSRATDKVEELKQNQSRATDKVEELKQNQSRAPDKVEVLKQNQSRVPDKVEELKQNQSRVPDKVEELKQNQSRVPDKVVVLKQNQSRVPDKVEELKQNQTRVPDKVEELKQNQSSIDVAKPANTTVNSSPKSGSDVAGIAEKGGVKNLTSSLMKQKNNATVKKVSDDLIKSLKNCDLFDGNWVKDESYPLYKPGSCSLIDEQFNCFLNGRPDNGYHKLKWKPKGCSIPRLDGSHMLEMLRGKRLVFVGDSLNRNMWESLVCILRNSVKDKKKVYEEKGRLHFRAEASYSFVFEEYKCTVEFFVAPFIVQEWEVTGKNGTKKETLRLDLMSRAAERYKNADIIVFNTGHWWTHEKTSTGKDYYQEGTHVYSDLNVLEAFRKALTTWGRWVDSKINPNKSLVFFRGYSASHFSGGQWNSGGQCDHETEPIKNETYLTPYPPKMAVLEKVMKGMKTPATYLNITRMTDYRKDGHPSIYRKLHMTEEERRSPLHFQDCSHWCLPGVPDAWNEILYAELLVKLRA